jgi:hypothetical protein
MTLLEHAAQLKNGIKTLKEWLGDGAKTVSTDQAQLRANVCLQCPKHSTTAFLEEITAGAIKRQVELKNHLQLRVYGEKSLHVCEVCGCAMKLKVWLPLETILPDEEEKAKFDPRCWLLREKP